MNYKIIRFFANGNRRTIKRGLTKAEAQEHCSDPETSSTTAQSPLSAAITKTEGPWFDGYDEDTEEEEV